jgi:hypothetical protein
MAGHALFEDSLASLGILRRRSGRKRQDQSSGYDPFQHW